MVLQCGIRLPSKWPGCLVAREGITGDRFVSYQHECDTHGSTATQEKPSPGGLGANMGARSGSCLPRAQLRPRHSIIRELSCAAPWQSTREWLAQDKGQLNGHSRNSALASPLD